MKSLDIKIQRTGFPFKLAGREFFFDCSAENIENYYANWEQAQKELEEYSASKTDMELEDGLLALNKAYGLLIGEDAFKELYEETPDMIAWQQAFVILADGINENVQEYLKQTSKKAKQAKKDYLLKQAKKKG